MGWGQSQSCASIRPHSRIRTHTHTPRQTFILRWRSKVGRRPDSRLYLMRRRLGRRPHHTHTADTQATAIKSSQIYSVQPRQQRAATDATLGRAAEQPSRCPSPAPSLPHNPLAQSRAQATALCTPTRVLERTHTHGFFFCRNPSCKMGRAQGSWSSSGCGQGGTGAWQQWVECERGVKARGCAAGRHETGMLSEKRRTCSRRRAY
jgi:hypothetical protein